MLLSIALIMMAGLICGWICEKLRLPGLLGMIIAGIVMGPYALNIIDESILGISEQLRKIALIIILLRAGISLNISDLKRVGRPAALMCFLPACFEIAGMIILAPVLLGVSRIEAAIMGAVVAAVSPAVIVPRMIKLMEEGYGKERGIPQLVLAGASVDDIFVIVIFQTFLSMAVRGKGVEVWDFSTGSSGAFVSIMTIPASIILGACVGIAIGLVMNWFFSRIHVRDTVKIVITLSVSFILVSIEDKYESIVPFSALIAIMFIAMTIRMKRPVVAKRLSVRLNKLWVVAELFLFVLVGCFVDISCAMEYGFSAVVLILLCLIFRTAGVMLCLVRTNLSFKERLFCVISYIPKATVQAAIGGIPLSMGLGCGGVVLTVAVLAILITAPMGAWGIDISYKKMLSNLE